jgi:hypothetical protein
MPLNEEQKQELRNILNSDLFQAAKEEVLERADWAIHEMAAPEQGMTLAVEKGVRKAFRMLQQVSAIHTPPPQPQLRNTIKHTTRKS